MVIRPNTLKAMSKLHPWWVSGFVDGEGCFHVGVFKNATLRLGYQVQCIFSVTQHLRDQALLVEFITFFGCGYVQPDGPLKSQFQVRALGDLKTIIIPFFEKYPLNSQKKQDFEDFKLVVTMLSEGGPQHLTPEGLEQIRNIKTGMNRGRKGL